MPHKFTSNKSMSEEVYLISEHLECGHPFYYWVQISFLVNFGGPCIDSHLNVTWWYCEKKVRDSEM